MEEALYGESGATTTRPAEFTWVPDGDPPGTDGNLKYWDYSKAQYLTLAALVQKLRQVYPALKGNKYSTEFRSVDASFTGITMHGHIKDAAEGTVDVAPHLNNAEEWDLFLKMVGEQTGVIKYPVWRNEAEDYKSHQSWVDDLIVNLEGGLGGMDKEIITNPAMATVAGVHRAQSESLKDSKTYRKKAAESKFKDSNFQKAKQGVGKAFEAGGATRPYVLSTEESVEDNEYTVDEAREIGMDLDGLY
jgi:hypothetical protein